MQKNKTKSCDNINILNFKICEACKHELDGSYIHCDMCRSCYHEVCFNNHHCVNAKRLQRLNSVRVLNPELLHNPDISISSRSEDDDSFTAHLLKHD